MLMDKKGFTSISDVMMFFASFMVIGLGIGTGIFLFYSHDVDVRSEDAKALSNKLMIAVIEEGKLNPRVLDGDFNIYEEAGVNPNVIRNGDYYFKIEIFENGKLARDPIIEGNRDFRITCGLRSDKFPKCHPEEILVDNYEIKILAASNQFGGRL